MRDERKRSASRRPAMSLRVFALSAFALAAAAGARGPVGRQSEYDIWEERNSSTIDLLLAAPAENFEKVKRLYLAPAKLRSGYSIDDSSMVLLNSVYTLKEELREHEDSLEDTVALHLLIAEALMSCSMNARNTSVLVNQKFKGRDWGTELRGILGTLIEDYGKMADDGPGHDRLRKGLAETVNGILADPCARSLGEELRKAVIGKYVRDASSPLASLKPVKAIGILRNLKDEDGIDAMLAGAPGGLDGLLEKMEMACAAERPEAAIGAADAILEMRDSPEGQAAFGKYLGRVAQVYIMYRPEEAEGKFLEDSKDNMDVLVPLYIAALGKAGPEEAGNLRTRWLQPFMARMRAGWSREREDGGIFRTNREYTLFGSLNALAAQLSLRNDCQGALFVADYIMGIGRLAADRRFFNLLRFVDKCNKALGRPGDTEKTLRKCLENNDLNADARERIDKWLKALQAARAGQPRPE